MKATKKILIIDDDEDVLDMMTSALVTEGFDVKTSEKADDITEMIHNYKPDVLLIDYILKGINGGEICHQVKTGVGTSALPVIILSAHSKVLMSLGQYGCDKFIAKPFDVDYLIGSIHTLFLPSLAQA